MPDVLLCQGNAMHLPLADASVHCCVTSPPYYGLRDYATGTWEGGDAACTHTQTSLKPSAKSTLSDHGDDGRSPYLDTLPGIPYRSACRRCGATRVDQQLGLEPTIDAYVATMVQVFREVWRVLHPTGTLWLNLSDSYNSARGGAAGHLPANTPIYQRGETVFRGAASGLKEKDLCMIPARVALALQQDGWYLRSDCIWDKPSCMPESVQDRPTRSHEYVFLFSKQARYFYDGEAIKEQGVEPPRRKEGYAGESAVERKQRGFDNCMGTDGTRNARTVWRIPSEPFSGAHFAAFPTALVRRCLLAGAPSAVCSQCNAPHRRIVERQRLLDGQQVPLEAFCPPTEPFRMPANGIGHARYTTQTTDHGFEATCRCNAGTGKAVVVDPFVGSGTTLLVARELGHHAIGIDLSLNYVKNIARVRLGFTALHAWQHGAAPQPVAYDDLPLFADATPDAHA